MNDPVGQEGPPPTKRRQRWGTVILILAVVGLYILTTRPAPPPEGWGTDFQVAIEEAESTDRKVLAAFHMPGCPPCTVMNRTVLNQAAVRQALGDYVPVQVDTTVHPELAARWGAYAAPTYAVIDPNGRLLAKCEGLQTVEQFVTFLKQAANSPSIKRGHSTLTASSRDDKGGT